MAYSNDLLNRIYEKTNGCCHICYKKLSFSNYGIHGSRAAWQIDHSNPKANGGSNYVRNLLPACISCNASKGKASTRSARSFNGKTRAPLSAKKIREVRTENTVSCVALGALVGSLGGPAGVAIGVALGGMIGYHNSPSK